jgi:hypothetical protein
VLVAAVGLIVAVQPFTGDQALFATGARQLAHGDVLYRDIWDVKQPGIYLFYLAGHAAVGDGETALHLFELAVLVLFGGVLALSLRDTFARPWVAATVPVLVVGIYYATAEPVQLGQVESIVGIPLFATLWSSDRASRPGASRWWLAAAGLAGGAVLLLKLVCAPLVLACLVPTFLSWRHADPAGRAGRIARDAGALLAGFVLPVGAALVYFAAHGQLGTVRWTYFEVTPETTSIAGRPLRRLLDGGARTAARWAVPIVLAGVGLVATFRRGWTRLELGLLAWAIAAVPVFLVQHWWIYQYAMVLVPLGVFAAHGVDALASRITARRGVALAVVFVVLSVPLGLRVLANTRDLVQHGGALTGADRVALHVETEPNYRDARAWAAHLDAVGATPHGVYVLGNPLDVYLAGRRVSVAVNGWSPEQYPASVWRRLRTDLISARPDEIVVDRFSRRIMRSRSPETLAIVRRDYVRVGRSGDEVWYRHRGQPARGATGRTRG